MDQKLGWEWGARTHPQQHYFVRRGHPFFTDGPHQKSTNNDQTMTLVATSSLDNTKRHTMTFHHTHHNDTCVGAPQQTFTVPDCAYHFALVLHLIKWLNWPPPDQRRGCDKGQRSHWVSTLTQMMAAPKGQRLYEGWEPLLKWWLLQKATPHIKHIDCTWAIRHVMQLSPAGSFVLQRATSWH